MNEKKKKKKKHTQKIMYIDGVAMWWELSARLSVRVCVFAFHFIYTVLTLAQCHWPNFNWKSRKYGHKHAKTIFVWFDYVILISPIFFLVFFVFVNYTRIIMLCINVQMKMNKIWCKLNLVTVPLRGTITPIFFYLYVFPILLSMPLFFAFFHFIAFHFYLHV